MTEDISKVQRWLDLIAYLVGRHFPVPVEELMERLPAYARQWRGGDEKVRASVRRKFERDKDELRELGIPLETVTYSINYGMEEAQGYRIRKKDLFLPYLKLIGKAGLSRRPGRPGPETPTRIQDRGEAIDAPEPPALLADAELFNVTPDGSIEIRHELAADAVWGLKELADLPGFPMAPAARSAFRKFTFDLEPGMMAAAAAGPSEHAGAPAYSKEGQPEEEGGDDAGAPAEPEDVRAREEPTPLTHKHVHFAIPPETARAEAHMEALSDALLRRKKVTFLYYGIERDKTTGREVRPYGLLFKHSHWYLVGWDETRDAERIFRVDRMESVEVNPSAPATPDYEMPDEPVLERYRDREAWELGEADDVVEATVRFRFPLSLWAARNHHGEAVRQEPDGSTLRRFEVRQPNPFLRWILSLQGEAQIESPPALAEGLRTMAKQVADLYREDADG